MTDDPKKRHSGDQLRVNVNQPEATNWCKKFGCTIEELKAAVKAVGVMANDVEKHLKGK